MTDSGIDHDLYDRQLRVFGAESMVKLSKADFLICGLSGLGVETAKNLILAGPRSVTLWDPTICTYSDQSSQFYIREESIASGASRAAASLPQLGELNSHVQVKSIDDAQLDDQVLKKFSVVLAIGQDDEAWLSRVGSYCHSNQIGFIQASARGLFGTVFVDFGDKFEIRDADGEVREDYVITGVMDEGDKTRIVLAEKTRVQFETGATIVLKELASTLQAAEGLAHISELNNKEFVATVITPDSIDIDVRRADFGSYETGGSVTEVIQPKIVDFLSWNDALKTPPKTWAMEDWCKIDNPPQQHIAWQALRRFYATNKRFPAPGSEADSSAVLAFAREINGAEGSFSVDQLDESMVRQLADGSTGNLNPLAAYLGGIVAQECVKFTGKYTPIHQFYYFDAAEVTPEAEWLGDRAATNSRYDGQVAVLGQRVQDTLGNLNVFLVGAGALGCELLKNFACMGIGAGPNGSVQVTDLDSIERSNLNRQFLFRVPDIGGMKSTRAARAVKVMNPAINITAHEDPVGKETEGTFDAKFWEPLDVVVNGLDNIQARLYVDERCVEFKKPLLESGTLGTKANTQVVLPHLTENYGASKDPPEKQIAVCTEKHFPYKIAHTVQWAKNEFNKLFDETPTDANNYLDDPNYIQTLLTNTPNANQQRETLTEIHKHLTRMQQGLTFDQCITEARMMFEERFSSLLKQLLFNFPPGAKTREGTPFWSPPKRPPTPVEFDAHNELHMGYVMAAANLLANLYGVEGGNSDPAYFEGVIGNIVVPEFEPKSGVRIKQKDDDDVVEGSDDDAAAVERLIKDLPKPQVFGKRRLNAQEFEKDVDSNHHIDYISTAANLRGSNYGITPVSRHEVKGIAGNIVPAVATTTCMITGLVCLELLKVVQKKPIAAYKNAFVNLALPLAAFSEPLPPAKHESKEGEIRAVPDNWTVWDSIDFKGDLTVQEILDIFQSRYNADVCAIASGRFQLYQPYFPAHKKRLTQTISELWKQVRKEATIGPSYLELVVLAEDKDDDSIEVDVPVVRVYYQEPKE